MKYSTTQTSEVTSDSETELILEGSERFPNKPKSIACYVLAAFCALALVIVSIAVVLLFLQHVGDNKDDQQYAFDKIQNLRTFDELSQQENTSFVPAFEAFDLDSDGYLNRSEFTAYFERQMNSSSLFDKIDANHDYIISYLEALVYIRKLNAIEEVWGNSVHVAEVIREKYKFQLTEDSRDLFLEYLTILTYFEPFASENNAYIRKPEFLNISAQIEFSAYDDNNDGMMSYGEFYNMLFGHGENSWKGDLEREYGQNYEDVMVQINAVMVAEAEVDEAKPELCPVHVMKDRKSEGVRRRLACRWETKMVYRCDSWGNCGWEAVAQLICSN